MNEVGGKQAVALTEFYSMPTQRVLLSKAERQTVWKDFRETRRIPDDLALERTCPALHIELRRAIDDGHHVQSAIFSECVYSQTLANQLGLGHFADLRQSTASAVEADLQVLLDESSILPRYLYRSADGSISLIQAGGHAGVDAILMARDLGLALHIEFKEPKAKTSEPDLPRYQQDGNLVVNEGWARRNPQFMPMVREQMEKSLNFFDVAGSNVNDFTAESIQKAVRDNYAGERFADVICTEDRNAYLTVLPAHQLGLWADLKGEIRPAGRNSYPVWTSDALRGIIAAKGGVVSGDDVLLPAAGLTPVSPRGGTGISRYKIHPLFFVRAGDVNLSMSDARFRLGTVRQLLPTISAHVYFTNLNVNTVRAHYLGG